jgi:hypothetical protein
MIKSPFFVIEDAVSPAKCDLITQQLGIQVPSIDTDGRPLKHERLVVDAALLSYLHEAITPSLDALEERYDSPLRGFLPPIFQQYFENPNRPAEKHGCESSEYKRKKWTKVKDVDLVGFLWLKDFNSGVPLDPRFETYGGKLEFPAFNFSLVPSRGTIVIFPAGPHFITAISPVLVGSLEMVKLNLQLKAGWTYDPRSYPGTFTEWFN